MEIKKISLRGNMNLPAMTPNWRSALNATEKAMSGLDALSAREQEKRNVGSATISEETHVLSVKGKKDSSAWNVKGKEKPFALNVMVPEKILKGVPYASSVKVKDMPTA